jgi:hypothetical protein
MVHVRIGSNATDPSGPQRRPMSALAPRVSKSLQRNEMTKCAISRHMQLQQILTYSITSSASESRLSEYFDAKRLGGLRIDDQQKFLSPA